MDYSKAYNKMDPWISGRAMEETGIPGNLVRTLLKVWTNQERWVQFDGQLGKEALCTSLAHPQGGPWGPAVMQLWMAGGAIRIREKEKEKEGSETTEHPPVAKRSRTSETMEAPPATKRRRAVAKTKGKGKGARKKEGEIRMSIYMDDRTVVANKKESLLWAMEEWHKWSRKVGLRENLDKQAIVVAKTVDKEARNKLKEALEEKGWEASLKENTEVLGAILGNVTAKLTKKEEKRVNTFYSRTQMIGSISETAEQERMLKRSLGMPVGIFIWMDNKDADYDHDAQDRKGHVWKEA